MTRDNQPPLRRFKFKQWLSLKDAAKQLSEVLGQDFSGADVVRLALEDRLMLSVDFVNRAYANLGHVQPVVDYDIVAGDDCEPLPRRVVLWRGNVSCYGVLINEMQVVHLVDQVTAVQGLWDLPLIGCERLDAQHEYQRLSDGPPVRAAGGPSLTLVHRAEGVWAQLLMPKDRPTSTPFDEASLALRRPFPDTAFSSDFEDAEALGEIPDGPWWLAPGLPKDSVFVIRTDAIIQFLERERSGSQRQPAGFANDATIAVIASKAGNHSAAPDTMPEVLEAWNELKVRFLSDE